MRNKMDKIKKNTENIIVAKNTLKFSVVTTISILVLTGCFDFDNIMNDSSNVSSTGGTVEFSDQASKQKIVTFEVIGKGLIPETAINTGQGRLMAERAAINDGYRQLVEKIRGVYVDAYSQTTNGVIDYELIRTKTQSWLRGSEIIEVKEAGYGIFNAKLLLRIYFTERDMIWWPSGIGEGVIPASLSR